MSPTRRSAGEHARVPPRTLGLEGLTVRYGAVIAVTNVSYRLEPGTVTGLIGPNGAGKTSLIDAISGFTSAEGKVRLDDVDLSKAPAVKRARAGVARSFQSLELFEDSTVFENLSVAADPQDFRSYLTDLVWPINPPFPPECGARRAGVPTRPGPAPRRPGPVVREAAAARHRPGRRDESERAPARRAGRRPELDREHRAGPCGPAPGRRLGHGHPRRRARHELRDGSLRSGDRARLREADRLRHARSGPVRSGGDRRLPRRPRRRRSVTRTGVDRPRHRSQVARDEAAAAGNPQPQGRLPRARGRACRQPHGQSRRGRVPARPQRRRQDDHAADDRRRAGTGRRDRDVQQRADLHADAPTCPRRWHRPDHRGTTGLHEDVGTRQPAPRRRRRSRARSRCSPSSNRG